jgi:MinD-like ATPase involved in chromosome partitioning or flagellar assembly/DNA-binding transcriptional ArsR family regulator
MPKIVSVHSFRHGTGKSNLIANLAVSIARQGQHVGVLNTDLHPPGIHTLFGLDDSQCDRLLNYYLWGGNTSHESLKRQVPSLHVGQGEITVMGRGVYLAPSSIQINEIPNLLQQGHDMGTLSQSFFELNHRLNLDCMLIDTYPNLNEETLLSIAISDVLVLILGLDNQSFQGVAVALDVARKLGVPQILLIANQVLPSFSPEDVQQQLEQTYGERVAGVLPFSEEMLQLASSSIFCLHYPNHPLTEKIQAIAQQIVTVNSRKPVSAPVQVPVPAASPNLESSVDLTMFDVLTLPETQRRIVNCIMRQGNVSVAQLALHIGQDEETIYRSLKMLVEQGFIQEFEQGSQTYYRPYMLVKQKRQLPANIWELLGDNVSE